DQGDPRLDATAPRISTPLPFRGPVRPECASGCVNSASNPRRIPWQPPFCCPAAGSAPSHTAVHVLRGSWFSGYILALLGSSLFWNFIPIYLHGRHHNEALSHPSLRAICISCWGMAGLSNGTLYLYPRTFLSAATGKSLAGSGGAPGLRLSLP